MKPRRKLILLVTAVASLAATGVAAATLWSVYMEAIPPTVKYLNVDRAVADGYSLRLPDLTGATCIEQAGQGGMGVHMVNVGLLDGRIDSRQPEVLVYEPRAGGGLQLVAVEYVVFESAWSGASPPSLFGRQFDYVPVGNRYGLPAFYALHAWVWKYNPSGVLHAWNPLVDCDDA